MFIGSGREGGQGQLCTMSTEYQLFFLMASLNVLQEVSFHYICSNLCMVVRGESTLCSPTYLNIVCGHSEYSLVRNEYVPPAPVNIRTRHISILWTVPVNILNRRIQIMCSPVQNRNICYSVQKNPTTRHTQNITGTEKTNTKHTKTQTKTTLWTKLRVYLNSPCPIWSIESLLSFMNSVTLSIIHIFLH